jgi:iron complex transport system substrate-binding protein
MKAGLVAAALIAAVSAPAAGFVDDAGRTLMVPPEVRRVFPAGPPASVIVYMLAPDKLLGWTRAISPPERPFLPQSYADLPELGRLTGRGNTVNLERLVASRPDLVLDLGSTGPTYVSLADRVQAQTGVPYALIGGRLADTATTFRRVGQLIGASDRAEVLARYAEETLAEVRGRIAGIPEARRPGVYLARGPRGLETGVAGSLTAEALELVGARNVAPADLGAGGLVAVSPERLLLWQPDVVITFDRAFYRSVSTDPTWQQVKAVREGRVYLSPGLPFTWIDSPPAANRLIGVRWLAKLLYPELFPEDLRETTRRFYALFYHQEPSDAQLDDLLAGSRSSGSQAP